MAINLVPSDLPNNERQHRTLIAATVNEIVRAVSTTGLWTPVDTSGAGLTLTITDARYWRLGSLVIASAYLAYPVTASGATAMLNGRPFATDANGSSRQGNVTYTDAAMPLFVLPIGSSTSIVFLTTGGAFVTNAQLSGKTILFQLIYQTDA